MLRHYAYLLLSFLGLVPPPPPPPPDPETILALTRKVPKVSEETLRANMIISQYLANLDARTFGDPDDLSIPPPFDPMSVPEDYEPLLPAEVLSPPVDMPIPNPPTVPLPNPAQAPSPSPVQVPIPLSTFRKMRTQPTPSPLGTLTETSKTYETTSSSSSFGLPPLTSSSSQKKKGKNKSTRSSLPNQSQPSLRSTSDACFSSATPPSTPSSQSLRSSTSASSTPLVLSPQERNVKQSSRKTNQQTRKLTKQLFPTACTESVTTAFKSSPLKQKREPSAPFPSPISTPTPSIRGSMPQPTPPIIIIEDPSPFLTAQEVYPELFRHRNLSARNVNARFRSSRRKSSNSPPKPSSLFPPPRAVRPTHLDLPCPLVRPSSIGLHDPVDRSATSIHVAKEIIPPDPSAPPLHHVDFSSSSIQTTLDIVPPDEVSDELPDGSLSTGLKCMSLNKPEAIVCKDGRKLRIHFPSGQTAPGYFPLRPRTSRKTAFEPP